MMRLLLRQDFVSMMLFFVSHFLRLMDIFSWIRTDVIVRYKFFCEYFSIEPLEHSRFHEKQAA